MKEIRIDERTKEAIEKTLSKGDRVEIIPVKDGLKILKVKREEIKNISPS